jgi:SpoVK/Ycf46/Vps4 family AAA+-type ATPase
MAQADILVDLIKAAKGGDQVSLQKAAESLIQDERAKGHRVLAERLSRSIRPEGYMPSKSSVVRPLAFASGPHKDLVHEIAPERSMASLMLADDIKEQLLELVQEQQRVELLHSYNLKPRHRVLVAGPPGNGKTTLAEALAFELMYPLVVVRYETLVGSYLGETAARLKNVFDFVKTQRCVLFFDEFETLGKERGDSHETGEIKRVVSSLLLQIDSLPDYVVVVAASNHPELLDKAVWRRFQLKIELPLPTRAQLVQFIDEFQTKSNVTFGLASETIAKGLAGVNFAEAEELCMGIVRQAVLSNQTTNAKKITSLKLAQWRNRLKPAA